MTAAWPARPEAVVVRPAVAAGRAEINHHAGGQYEGDNAPLVAVAAFGASGK